MSRIVEVRPFMVGFEQGTGGPGNMLIVRIRTEDGLEGFGEGSLPHKTRAVAGAVEDFAEYLVGQDDALIERHWQVLYRNSFQRGGVILMTAQSAIDQALWDIAGKRLGLPVWRLMGGAVRDRILLYTHPGGASREEIVDRTHQRIEEGYRAFKTGIPGTAEWISDRKKVRETYENVAAIREAVGDDMKIMVDAHGKQTPTVAIEIANALEELDLLFLRGTGAAPQRRCAAAGLQRRRMSRSPWASGCIVAGTSARRSSRRPSRCCNLTSATRAAFPRRAASQQLRKPISWASPRTTLVGRA